MLLIRYYDNLRPFCSVLTLRFQYAAVDRLERAIESIQSTIEDQGGSLIVKMKVRSPIVRHVSFEAN